MDFTPTPEITKLLLYYEKLLPYQKEFVKSVIDNFVHVNVSFEAFNERLKMEAFLNE